MRRRRDGAMRGGRAAQQGYVLLMAMAALAAGLWLAARFADRVDGLRAQAVARQAEADDRVREAGAMAAGLYMVATRQAGPATLQSPADAKPLWADGRPYAMPSGGYLEVQDERGLFTLFEIDREDLRRLLRQHDLAPQEVDSLIDVLLDYQDGDKLARLNGAETEHYLALGLPPPSDEWLLSTRELYRMPLWRDRPALLARLLPLLSVQRQGRFNANTAPPAVLRARLPFARPEQLALMDTLRRQVPFLSAAHASAATGYAFDDERYLFHVSDHLRLTAYGGEGRSGLQYNLRLTPAGLGAPWQITGVQRVVRNATTDAPLERSTPFPLVSSAVAAQDAARAASP